MMTMFTTRITRYRLVSHLESNEMIQGGLYGCAQGISGKAKRQIPDRQKGRPLLFDFDYERILIVTISFPCSV